MKNVPNYVESKNLFVQVNIESKKLREIMSEYEDFFMNWDGEIMPVEMEGDSISFSDWGDYYIYVDSCTSAGDIVDVLAGLFDADYASAGYRYCDKEDYSEDEECDIDDLLDISELAVSTQILMDYKEEIISSMLNANIKIYEGDDDYEIDFNEVDLEEIQVTTIKLSYTKGETIFLEKCCK